MKNFIIGLAVVVVILILTFVFKFNNLVNLHEATNGGKALVASAVNTCSEKMKSVWQLAQQEGLLEKETYIEVAKARAGYEDAKKAFENANTNPNSSVFDLTKLATGFGQAMVNVRVAFEAYPQLKTADVYQKAMTAVEEGFNEIKTALDDWIVLCKNYNTARRYLVNKFLVDTFGWDFPAKVEYYDGGIKEPEKIKITADDLNPNKR